MGCSQGLCWKLFSDFREITQYSGTKIRQQGSDGEDWSTVKLTLKSLKHSFSYGGFTFLGVLEWCCFIYLFWHHGAFAHGDFDICPLPSKFSGSVLWEQVAVCNDAWRKWQAGLETEGPGFNFWIFLWILRWVGLDFYYFTCISVFKTYIYLFHLLDKVGPGEEHLCPSSH